MSTKCPSLAQPVTLAEVLQRIAVMDQLSRQRRYDLSSAIRRIAALLGSQPADIVADVEALRRKVALFTPVAAGMSSQRWNNVRSLLSAALALAGVTVIRRRRRDSLAPDWLALLDHIADRYERARLSRFFSWGSANGISPDQVGDAVVARFAQALQQSSLIERPTQVHRDFCLAWNRSAATVPGWPATQLTVPHRRRDYALPVSAYPESFGADIAAYLEHLAGDDLFSETACQPAVPVTIRNTRQRILQFAAALVLSGRDAGLIRRLADLVAPETVRTALAFFWARNGKRKTGQIHHFALLAIKIAKHWANVGPEHLDALRAIRKQVDPGETGMTARNRARLRQFDDPENVKRLLTMPAAILRGLPAGTPPSYAQAVKVQSALAVAILLVAPLRVKNLAGLTLDRHLLQTRVGGVWHLVFPTDEIKNKTPLEFELPAGVRTLLDVYLKQCRPLLAQGPSNYLFPARKGGAKTPAQLAAQVKRTIAQQTGIDLNVHAFRHLSALLFLRQFPGEYETVRLLLGHKSIKTTISAYCGIEQADALRRYDHLIERYRLGEEARHAA